MQIMLGWKKNHEHGTLQRGNNSQHNQRILTNVLLNHKSQNWSETWSSQLFPTPIKSYIDNGIWSPRISSLSPQANRYLPESPQQAWTRISVDSSNLILQQCLTLMHFHLVAIASIVAYVISRIKTDLDHYWINIMV